jgi:peptide/nickel transport system substrate-binding protein
MRSRMLLALIAGLFTALALGLTACGDDDDGGGVQASEFAPVTAPPDDAQKGGTLTVIAAADVDYMDPGAAYYQFTYMIMDATQRKLLGWKPTDVEKPSPDLAASEPTISDDGLTITFKLKDGIRFSPPVNREVTSADFKYAVERSLMPGVANGYVPSYFGAVEGFAAAQAAAGRNKTVAPDISGIQTPDDKTLVFKLTRPESSVLIQSLGLPISSPVPEEYAKPFDAETPSTYGPEHVVGTGPYMVENDDSGNLTGYTPGKEIILVRNPNWDPSTDYRPAFLDRVEVKEGFEDTQSASQKILKGDSQVTGDIIPEGKALKDAATMYPDQMALVTSGGNRYIALNTEIPPFDDINVRKAVVAGFDRSALRLARGGELAGPIATHFIMPGIPGFEEAGGLEGTGLDFLSNPNGDPEVSAEYFRKAGMQSGKYEGNESIFIAGENSGIDKKVSEVAADEFRKLGFDVDLRQTSSDVMYTRFCGVPKSNYNVCPTVGWIKDFNDGQAILDVPFNGASIVPTNNYNWPLLDVPAINNAMDKSKLIDEQQQRNEAWGKIDTQVTAQAPAIPFLWDQQANLRSENVNGVINLFNAVWDLSSTSLKNP